jgi:hypothetical protein
MGSITFVSQDGFSRVHDHVLNDIRLVKKLALEDDDVILSLNSGFFEDFTWIAGEDRPYFAERLRSVLACNPVGEWSFRGLNEFVEGDPEASASDPLYCDRRIAGIHSVIAHLEANAEFPIVIYHSVSASFPTVEFVPADWNLKHGEYSQQELDALSHPDQWKLVWPHFLRLHSNRRWISGLTKHAFDRKSALKLSGFWRDSGDETEIEQRMFRCKSVKELSHEIRSELLQFSKSSLEEIHPEANVFVISEMATARVCAEPFARSVGDRLVGYSSADVRIGVGRTKDVGRLVPYDLRTYAEEPSKQQYAAVLCVPVFASADVVLHIVRAILPTIGRNPLLIVSAMANSPQSAIALNEFEQMGCPVSIRSMNWVDYDLVPAWHHTNELVYEGGISDSNPSRWMFDRMIEGMKARSLEQQTQ